MAEHIATLRFPPRTALPPGYAVQWWEQDCRYHWVLADGAHSDGNWNRWACWRDAWEHYRSSPDHG